MIKLKNKKRLVRECIAVWEDTDEAGVTTTQDIRVRYFDRSVRELKVQTQWHDRKAKEDPNQIIWLSDTLPFVVESLPDIEGLDGKPIRTQFDKDGVPTRETVANFEEIPKKNLEAINKAIYDDLSPKDQPSK
jgi:hypothetical protein